MNKSARTIGLMILMVFVFFFMLSYGAGSPVLDSDPEYILDYGEGNSMISSDPEYMLTVDPQITGTNNLKTVQTIQANQGNRGIPTNELSRETMEALFGEQTKRVERGNVDGSRTVAYKPDTLGEYDQMTTKISGGFDAQGQAITYHVTIETISSSIGTVYVSAVPVINWNQILANIPIPNWNPFVPLGQCLDGAIQADRGEQCEIDVDGGSLTNNPSCSQTSFVCYNGKTYTRDAYGDCSANCKCSHDGDSGVGICVVGQCGATCDSNTQGCNLDTCTMDAQCPNGKLDPGEDCDPDIATQTQCGVNEKCSLCKCVPKTFCGDCAIQKPNDYGLEEQCEASEIFPYAPCGTGDVGQCKKGYAKCGHQCVYESQCVGAVNPSLEKCDKVDNDCDNVIDEGCSCTIGAKQACGSDIGACKKGEQTCIDPDGDKIGEWGTCAGETESTSEICDYVDNNCNGNVDEGVRNKDGKCGRQQGMCAYVEICDDIDNDGDGMVNEDLDCEPVSSPVHRGIYFKGTPIIFKQSNSGGNIDWRIDEDNIDRNDDTFTHTFTTTGQKTITMKTTNAAGKLLSEKQIAILIVDGSPKGIFAFIEKPSHKQYVLDGDLKVEYSAKESYVIKIDGATCNSGATQGTITCLAGNCPVKTENAPSGCTEKISVNNPASDFSKLNFGWSFPIDSGLIVRAPGTGIDFSSGLQGYSKPGEYRIDLDLKYTEDNSLTKLFQREFYIGRSACSEDGTVFIELNSDGTEKERHLTSEKSIGTPYCSGVDRLTGTSDDCCPNEEQCIGPENGKPGGCYPATIKSCSDYDNKAKCNSGDAWKRDSLYTTAGCEKSFNIGVCTYNTLCSCSWKGEIGGGVESDSKGECKLRSVVRLSNIKQASCNDLSDKKLCEYKLKNEGLCENGFKKISIKADFISGGTAPAWCQDKDVTIPCGRSVLELSFFGLWQAAAALLVIIAAYLIIEKMKKKKRK